jgi:hypothetical protein
MLGEEYISKLVRHAVDLPLLESKVQKLRSEIIDLEFKKKGLNDTLTLQNAQLLDLGQTITNYQDVMDNTQQEPE